MDELDVTALLRHDCRDRRHVPTGRITGNGDTGRVEATARALLDYPLSGGIALLNLRWVLCLGRT
jgi:hypothetical protein